MKPSDLTPIIYAVAALSSICAVMLCRIAVTTPKPVPTALVDRAWGSVLLAAFVVIYAVAASAVDANLLAADDSRIVLRISAIILGFIPAIWLVRYWTRHF